MLTVVFCLHLILIVRGDDEPLTTMRLPKSLL